MRAYRAPTVREGVPPGRVFQPSGPASSLWRLAPSRLAVLKRLSPQPISSNPESALAAACANTRPCGYDKTTVSRFLQNASRILEAAESVSSSHASTYPEMTISIGPEGGIRMVTQGTGLPLDVLQQEHGAQMIYRVTQQESRVRLEGRAGSRTCLFEAEKPDRAARILLGDGPRYALVQAAQLAQARNHQYPLTESKIDLPVHTLDC